MDNDVKSEAEINTSIRNSNNADINVIVTYLISLT